MRKLILLLVAWLSVAAPDPAHADQISSSVFSLDFVPTGLQLQSSSNAELNRYVDRLKMLQTTFVDRPDVSFGVVHDAETYFDADQLGPKRNTVIKNFFDRKGIPIIASRAQPNLGPDRVLVEMRSAQQVRPWHCLWHVHFHFPQDLGGGMVTVALGSGETLRLPDRAEISFEPASHISAHPEVLTRNSPQDTYRRVPPSQRLSSPNDVLLRLTPPKGSSDLQGGEFPQSRGTANTVAPPGIGNAAECTVSVRSIG